MLPSPDNTDPTDTGAVTIPEDLSWLWDPLITPDEGVCYPEPEIYPGHEPEKGDNVTADPIPEPVASPIMVSKGVDIDKIVDHVRHRFPGQSREQVRGYLEGLAESGKAVEVESGKVIITRGTEILIVNPYTGGTYFNKPNKRAVNDYVRGFIEDEGGIVFPPLD